MTEAEWLAAETSKQLIEYLHTKARINRTRSGRRRLRLFGCACCRHIWHLFKEYEDCARVVEEAERYADGGSSRQVLSVLSGRLGLRGWGLPNHLVLAARCVADINALTSSNGAAQETARAAIYPALAQDKHESELLHQATLLRDIFGNPFRPVTFDPVWRTTTSTHLAQSMYDSRDFAAMPILADALQDAGCEEVSIHDHCRNPGPHVRGCWVVDLVLGKN